MEFLHKSPNQSPRDNDHRTAEAIVKKKPVWGQSKTKNLLKFQSPNAKKEKAGGTLFGTGPQQAQLALKHNMS